MNKTKFVLAINAFMLVIGAIAQTFDPPLKNAILSCLFIAWIATFIWHVAAPAPTEPLGSPNERK